MEYYIELLNILNAMSPYLLLGFFIAGLMHVYIPRWAYSRYLSGRGFRPVLLSALFGIPLPLCSCGVIPTAMSLKREGASDGATISFLIATPQTGVDSILATYGVLGLPFAIVRPIVALVVALIGGVTVDALSGSEAQGEAQATVCGNSGRKLGFIDALKYGFVDMLQDLGKWLVLGLIVAAAITIFVPDSLFELFRDNYILNIGVVLLLSVPMYICSTGSIPVAVSLLLKGISPGAALVFLMAGPATNVATLAVVSKVMGRRATLLYLATITLGAIAFAFVIDFLLPAEWFLSTLTATSENMHSCGAMWWQTTSTVIFISLLIYAYIDKLRNGSSHSHDVEELDPQQPAIRLFRVQGMRCNHCKANVERAISSLTDVESVTIELESGRVEVQGTSSTEQISTAVKALGFEIEEL